MHVSRYVHPERTKVSTHVPVMSLRAARPRPAAVAALEGLGVGAVALGSRHALAASRSAPVDLRLKPKEKSLAVPFKAELPFRSGSVPFRSVPFRSDAGPARSDHSP